jgi:hypothetical protein
MCVVGGGGGEEGDRCDQKQHKLSITAGSQQGHSGSSMVQCGACKPRKT